MVHVSWLSRSSQVRGFALCLFFQYHRGESISNLWLDSNYLFEDKGTRMIDSAAKRDYSWPWVSA